MAREAAGHQGFVVPPELAAVAERYGLPLPAGGRVRVEVVDDRAERVIPRQRTGEGRPVDGDHVATVGDMADAPEVDDPLSGWDPQRRAALTHLWQLFDRTGARGANLADELMAERRREAAADDDEIVAR